MRERYFVKSKWQTEWQEVSLDEFVEVEYSQGFRGGRPATGGFMGMSMEGRIEYDKDARGE